MLMELGNHPSLTLLQIANTAFAELGLTQVTAVVGSTSLQTQQMLALINREGWGLQQDNEWTALQALNIINIATPITTTGTLTAGSAIITAIPSTSGITANTWVVSGSAIPVAARVVSVDSATQITMDSEANAAATATTLTFAQDTYAFPTNFDRFINRTSWDRTNRWEVLGPDTPQIDEWHRSGIVVTGPRRHARQVGTLPNAYRLWPPPGATETVWETVFEYVQNTWVVSAGGTGKTTMTVDTDTSLIDPQAIILGVIWRFLRAKQFSYADQFKEWQDYKSSRIAKDGGAMTLSMARKPLSLLITSANVQDGFFPSNDST